LICAQVDGSLADGSPVSLTADVGVDALCHAMEAFVSKKSSPLSDGFALDALRGVGLHLRSAVDDEAEGRDGMARAAFLAGVSFSVSSVTLIHGMSRPLGARFHLAHGRSNAVLMPAVTAYSLAGARERYAQCGAALGFDDGDLPTALHDLASSLGVPSLRAALRERGVDERAFRDAVPVMARDALASGSPANNPLVPSEADVARLYHACYDND
jgi:alcohol dehydrogenase class IV